MRLVVATFCDAATIRAGLVNILGGGVTQVFTQTLPVRLSLTFVAVFELRPEELFQPVVARVQLEPQGGQPILNAGVRVQFDPEDAARPPHPELATTVPVSFDLSRAVVEGPGLFNLRLMVNQEEIGTFSFLVRDDMPDREFD